MALLDLEMENIDILPGLPLHETASISHEAERDERWRAVGFLLFL